MNKETIKVFGIAVMAPKQQPQAEKHCFGDCGKISMAGVVNDPTTGGLFICCQPTCPYTEEEIPNYGSCYGFERRHEITLRILRNEEQ